MSLHAGIEKPHEHPAIPLTFWPQIGVEDHAAVADVLRTGRLVDGRATAGLERAWAERLGRPADCVLTCANGTAAILIALQVLGVGPGDKVIVPAYTFSGSVLPIIQAGAEPVFVDTELDTHVMKLDQVLAVARSDVRVKAVIAVHLHGRVVDLRRLRAGLPDHVRIVEDCCQAHGSQAQAVLHEPTGKVSGPPVGLWGDAAAWSMNVTKALPAGEGGLLTFPEPADAADARTLRRFGEDWPPGTDRTYLVHDRRGGNWRMDELSAALGLAQLPRLDATTAQARANAHRLIMALRPLEIAGVLRMPHWQDGHSWQKFLVRFFDRAAAERAYAAADDANLPVTLWQRAPLSRHPAFERYETVDDRDAARTLDTSVLIFTERHPLFAQDGDTVQQIAARLNDVWSNL